MCARGQEEKSHRLIVPRGSRNQRVLGRGVHPKPRRPRRGARARRVRELARHTVARINQSRPRATRHASFFAAPIDRPAARSTSQARRGDIDRSAPSETSLLSSARMARSVSTPRSVSTTAESSATADAPSGRGRAGAPFRVTAAATAAPIASASASSMAQAGMSPAPICLSGATLTECGLGVRRDAEKTSGNESRDDLATVTASSAEPGPSSPPECAFST